MGDLVIIPANTIAASLDAASRKINQLAHAIRVALPACAFVTEHFVHGGIYTRTIRLPAGAVCAAVRYVVPTTLIIEGSCDVWSNGELTHVEGYSVIKGSAGRKIAFTTHSEVKMSMMFATTETDIEKIQIEFTDEHDLLVPLSKTDEHVVFVTGE